MSNNVSDCPDPDDQIVGPPEPDPFTPAEFAAWRGMLRVHTTVMRELDQRLQNAHGLSVDAYGLLITMVGQAGTPMTIGDLGERRNLTPSGISRAVDKLATAGLVDRTTNPADERSRLVGLTTQGLQRLREAQVTHHATVRELLLGNLSDRDIKTLGKIWEKAMPGAVTSPIWPI
jgi:DNA-binding MarR family transcriptional regulator